MYRIVEMILKTLFVIRNDRYQNKKIKNNSWNYTTRYAPEGKPMYQIVEELAEDNEYFAEVFILQMNACFPL